MIAEEEVAVKARKNPLPKIPRKEVEIIALAKRVDLHWESNPWLKMKWLSQAEFKGVLAAFGGSYDEKLAHRAGRKTIVKELSILTNQMNRKLVPLKKAVALKYGEERAKSWYAGYGFVIRKGVTVFPKERDSRIAALTLMKKGLERDEIIDSDYGLPYWASVSSAYTTLSFQAQTSREDLSGKVKTSNQNKSILRKALMAVSYMLAGNDPDNYDKELRAWGYTREVYT